MEGLHPGGIGMTYDHDSLFHYTFAQPEHTASLLAAILPPALASAIDWPSLRPEPGTSVDEVLQPRHADLLFSVQLGGQPLLLYLLLEHKSAADRWTALQLLRYVVRLRNPANSAILDEAYAEFVNY